ncbi:MAG TPA: FAD-dependent oxidoreductase [candidate division Zixibacteria bacterium]|nr:FAD-dependent oxidoreductase [candidate division Zixibacteria bacterium]
MRREDTWESFQRKGMMSATLDGDDDAPLGLGAGIGWVPDKWDLVADVVVVGSGAAGMPAAIKAADGGASVIVVEANYDVGGHAIISGGNVPLGGGTSAQRKYGIEDSPDVVFRDLTDWTILQPNGWPDYRYNDRAVMRAFADHCAQTFEFLLANGVVFKDVPPDTQGGHNIGNSAPRENHIVWTKGAGLESPNARGGTGLIRPLEASARAKGVRFLLNYKMTRIVREPGSASRAGRVVGISVKYTPRIMPGQTKPLKSFRSDGNIESTQPTLNVRARKAVILATGGSTGNVHFRRMFDPRLTEVLQVAGEPYTFQDASGELAAMAIGASLWGLANQILENGDNIRTQRALATRYNYMTWELECPIFPLVRATGLNVKDWHDLILVNQVGKRFYDETKGDYPHGNVYNEVRPYTPYDYRNSERIEFNPTKYNFFNAAVAMNEYSEPPDYSCGPVWAIFDSEAAQREKWKLTPPHVDPDGYFFSAPTLRELAAAIKNPYQARPIDGATLQETVERYNSFVESGVDLDFGKPKPKYKIAKPPFYAAWATPLVHDTRAGLRINSRCQVMDMAGRVIPGLYCAGESAGGFNQHGLGRCTTQGFIAGMNAALETARD